MCKGDYAQRHRHGGVRSFIPRLNRHHADACIEGAPSGHNRLNTTM